MSDYEPGTDTLHEEPDLGSFGDSCDDRACYGSALTREPLLTPEEEKMLAEATRNGDEKARRRLVEANMRLVISIARRYYCPDIPLDDLIQEGAIGLIIACERFDPSRGCRFSTYATHWIRQAISRAIDTKGRPIRVPSYIADTVKRIERCRAELARELGYPPPLDLLAQRVGLPVNRLVFYLRVTQSAISLDAIVGHEDRTAFRGVAVQTAIMDPEAEVLDRELQREVETILESLDEREREVMRRRFGFGGGEEAALQDIGAEFGISRERVRQIEVRALRRLRALARRRRLNEYLTQ